MVNKKLGIAGIGVWIAHQAALFKLLGLMFIDDILAMQFIAAGQTSIANIILIISLIHLIRFQRRNNGKKTR